MLKIGITGQKGFIGQYLVKHLKKDRIEVNCFEGNLLKTEDIEKYFSQNKVEQIIHLVGSFALPFENQITKNLMTTQKLLEIGVRFGLKKIIFSSSGAVYGEPIKDESLETDALKPNTLYGLTKMYAEECIKYYAQNYGLCYIILRFPNVYGQNNDKGVLFNFLSDIKNKEEITIAGNGEQSRNFLHVSDACEAIKKALSYDKSDVFNISNPVKVSINSLVKMLEKKYEFKIKYKQKDNNLKDLLLNIDKAQKKLKFYPKIVNISI